jgi:hypothetical protein
MRRLTRLALEVNLAVLAGLALAAAAVFLVL